MFLRDNASTATVSVRRLPSVGVQNQTVPSFDRPPPLLLLRLQYITGHVKRLGAGRVIQVEMERGSCYRVRLRRPLTAEIYVGGCGAADSQARPDARRHFLYSDAVRADAAVGDRNGVRGSSGAGTERRRFRHGEAVRVDQLLRGHGEERSGRHRRPATAGNVKVQVAGRVKGAVVGRLVVDARYEARGLAGRRRKQATRNTDRHSGDTFLKFGAGGCWG